MSGDFEISARVARRDFLLDVSLVLEARKRLALVGPSGAGKTSILRTVAGLFKPESGLIRIGGETVFDSVEGIDVPPEERRCGYVSQDYSLFPHLDAAANVAFGMRNGKAAARRRRAVCLLEQLGVGAMAKVRPSQLSGGERQRVALARALATEPSIFLLDEPLSALDAGTRDEALPALDEVLVECGVPVLLVTHSTYEAERLGDTTVTLQRGLITESRDHTEGTRWTQKTGSQDSQRNSVSIRRVIRR